MAIGAIFRAVVIFCLLLKCVKSSSVCIQPSDCGCEWWPKAKTIYCSNLTTFPLFSATIRNNATQIMFFDGAWKTPKSQTTSEAFRFPSVESIEITNSSLSEINFNLTWLSQSPRLEALSLDNNRFQRIDQVMLDNPRLKLINFDNNIINSINVESFVGLKNLSKLNFKNNKIRNIEGSIWPQGLYEIILTNNELSELNHSIFRNLSVNQLFLDRNQLHDLYSLPFQLSVNIYYLDLSHNLFQSLDKSWWSGTSKIGILALTGNPIIGYNPRPFASLHQLKDLFLAKTLLVEIDSTLFQGLETLEQLTLEGNQHLHSFSDDAFRDLGKLKFLDLSSSANLLHISSKLIKPLISLKNIQLTGMHLYSIDFAGLLDRPIFAVDLGRNNFRCDCRMRWMGIVVERHENGSIPINKPTLARSIYKGLEAGRVLCSEPPLFIMLQRNHLGPDAYTCLLPEVQQLGTTVNYSTDGSPSSYGIKVLLHHGIPRSVWTLPHGHVLSMSATLVDSDQPQMLLAESTWSSNGNGSSLATLHLAHLDRLVHLAGIRHLRVRLTASNLNGAVSKNIPLNKDDAGEQEETRNWWKIGAILLVSVCCLLILVPLLFVSFKRIKKHVGMKYNRLKVPRYERMKSFSKELSEQTVN